MIWCSIYTNLFIVEDQGVQRLVQTELFFKEDKNCIYSVHYQNGTILVYVGILKSFKRKVVNVRA